MALGVKIKIYNFKTIKKITKNFTNFQLQNSFHILAILINFTTIRCFNAYKNNCNFEFCQFLTEKITTNMKDLMYHNVNFPPELKNFNTLVEKN